MATDVVIYHRSSGRSSGLDQLRDCLAGRDVRWLDLAEADDLSAVLNTEMAHQCRTVIAAGGDGTVNATVNALMTLDPIGRPAMAIVPLGTANDFAGSLCIPDDIAEAVSLLETTPVGVDVVKVVSDDAERFYANIAAGGNCVRVSEAMTEVINERPVRFEIVPAAIAVHTVI